MQHTKTSTILNYYTSLTCSLFFMERIYSLYRCLIKLITFAYVFIVFSEETTISTENYTVSFMKHIFWSQVQLYFM